MKVRIHAKVKSWVRIVPEWNVKQQGTSKYDQMLRLESYQSGM